MHELGHGQYGKTLNGTFMAALGKSAFCHLGASIIYISSAELGEGTFCAQPKMTGTIFSQGNCDCKNGVNKWTLVLDMQ